MNHDLFHEVKYYLPETLPKERRLHLISTIESNGGQKAETMKSATHVITNSHRFEGWHDVDEGKIVSDFWVGRSMILGEVLPTEFYSADPTKIFSGVVGCGSGISPSDLPSLQAGIVALGGRWRRGLSKDVTHLFATSANSEKYATAMHYQPTTHVKVLLPHWFDDAIRLGSGKLSTLPYEWPDPKVLHELPSVEEAKIERSARSSRKPSPSKQMYFKTALWNPETGGPFPGPAEPVAKVWTGRKILLSSSLGLGDERQRVVEEAVKAAGGRIISSDDEEDEEDRVSDCDVFVTRWRTGKAFFTAFRANKIIGTLNWLLYVHATGILSSPMDQLLHYPVRKTPLLHDFTKHKITVTNYTGEAREYLKRLIQIMGAEFTPNMSGTNTVLIAATMGGEKTQKALSWSIAVVNHAWLEDCFVDWRDITPAVPKYIDFLPHVDFAPMLGERGIKLKLEHIETEEEEDVEARERPPVGTEASVREVEGILEDGDVIMDDQDAEEEEQRLAPARSRFRSGSERRVVLASVSPVKHRSSDDDDMMVDEPPKSTKRGKQRVKDEDKGKASASTQRGKQPERSEEVDRKSPQRKGKTKQVVEEEEEEEEEIDTARKAKPNGNGKEKEKPTKTGSKVSFAPEIDYPSAGPSNSRASKKTNTTSTTSKRKAQLLESASNDDEQDEDQSDSPPPKKRVKSNKVTSSTPSTSGPSASSSGKRKMTAGPGRDSAPRKPERVDSVQALGNERVAKGNSSSAVGSGLKKKPARIEVEDDEEEMPDAPRGRGSSSKKPDDDSADESPPPKPTKGKTKKETPKETPKATSKKANPNTSTASRDSRKSTGTIKIMTTTISLTDAVQKTLSKLGVKTASQVSECTHLIAPKIVRTEKLLCALAAGAWIVSDKWAIDSAEAKKLLPEEDYILDDKANEKKWNFRLADAIERAKESGGKLFENKSFYVTKGVPVDRKLLKTVVGAQGGKVLTQTPTVRILNSAPNRYVISCAEDISIWRPLTTDHVIYTQELVLTGALTQRIDWDNPAFQVSADSA
ncbi:hypothetical protein MSAN_00037000 [Mycena sanguinolenta]|uniref:BRCT domain-containing protein n=1 Tax=Mycena sanguinolenta TaxID=230812 RepID=A0A8H6ZF56_9AGAR|nr:hypothetical protein MSAN_00037000 [Mycena sanguinolenta]